MEYLEKDKIDFIEPDMWPPNSLDLNPVDYAVWRALQQRAKIQDCGRTEANNCH